MKIGIPAEVRAGETRVAATPETVKKIHAAVKFVAEGANGPTTTEADVVLKERRRLVLMVRETPLNLAHLRNMTAVTEMGGIVFPPVPAFYNRPQSVDELIDHTVGRVLDLLDVSQTLSPAWPGLASARAAANEEAP